MVILHLSAYEDGTEYFKTSAYKIQTPENYPEESIQNPEVCHRFQNSMPLIPILSQINPVHALP
jgi:hypothetical protein